MSGCECSGYEKAIVVGGYYAQPEVRDRTESRERKTFSGFPHTLPLDPAPLRLPRGARQSPFDR